METSTLEKKIPKLPYSLKIRVEGYIDALMENNSDSPSSITDVKKTAIPFDGVKPGFGGGTGIFGYMADDFDEPLDEMKEYM